MTLLLDSSFVYSLCNLNDRFSPIAREFAITADTDFIVPELTLVEASYLINRDIGHHGLGPFLIAFVRLDAELVSVTLDDIARVQEILVSYSSARFDLVDCCIMALAERLNITQICTFDRRDFSIFRPRHCDYLELLP